MSQNNFQIKAKKRQGCQRAYALNFLKNIGKESKNKTKKHSSVYMYIFHKNKKL